jgi:hypothetical protein
LILVPVLIKRFSDSRPAKCGARRSYSRSHTPKLCTYLLNTIFRCAGCGRKLRAQNSSNYRYYREMSHARKLPCPLTDNHGIRAEVFEERGDASFLLSGCPKPESKASRTR